VFNCGIGLCVVVSADQAAAAQSALSAAGETVFQVGEIRSRPEGAAHTIVV
jgi:phosphoribosylformylglycinamidine cyclo-ligase